MALPITIVEYNPRWPMMFGVAALRIRAALGPRALRIEHTGSTSVPGLAAKPLIDILLVVENSADENTYVPALEAAGYGLSIREPEWHEHRMFRDADTNLHVFSDACVEISRILRFRDWLRSHPEDRELYAETKRNLARQKWTSIDEYARAKTPVIEELLRRAGVQSGS